MDNKAVFSPKLMGKTSSDILGHVEPHIQSQSVHIHPDTYRVAFCATHHLPVVQPLRCKHFIKGPEVKLSLLQETGKLLCCIPTQHSGVAGFIL